MSADSESSMGLFERFLSLWVALCIASGVILGVAMPELFEAIASIEYASVNLVVAVFIWVMIYPMMVNVDFASLKDVGKKPKGLCITLVVNWCLCRNRRARNGERIYRRHDIAWRRALHRDGVCLESARAWRCQLHAGTSLHK